VQTIKTRSWPWFALTAALGVLAVGVLDGSIAGVVALGAFLAFFKGAFKGLGIQREQDPERMDRLGRGGMIGGF
jgi:hypothetical protein